ncbi:hypothetical protein NI939_12835 [Streptomyces sp. RKCA-744]|nr:hypothetical protein [Streptomyces sp. RKCA744]MCO8303630.1 hypothetical protein [Streptomyces sp. RKCA744]
MADRLRENASIRQIAAELGHSPSTWPRWGQWTHSSPVRPRTPPAFRPCTRSCPPVRRPSALGLTSRR